ncbi:hypothetical protein BDQ17DRAFT_266188 [Cyathus striatus]|nr:hypothetical protein BDQ17DRAFT_266188 [Cyathus striatus]
MPPAAPKTPTPSSSSSRNSFAAPSAPPSTPSLPPSAARRSISTTTSPYAHYAPLSGIPVAASPSPPTPQGGFKGLRSFLPFAKHTATTPSQQQGTSNAVGGAPVTPAKGGGFGFGSVRRSMQKDREKEKERERERERERELPVISIGRNPSTSTFDSHSQKSQVRTPSGTPRASLSISTCADRFRWAS